VSETQSAVLVIIAFLSPALLGAMLACVYLAQRDKP
jgi:hypothetical protein